MAYKYSSGPTKQDDIYAKKSVDDDGNTYINFEEDYIGLVAGGVTLLEASGSVVSSSVNISASAFYGDGSNLTGIASPIHAPWISGSTNTHSSMASTTTNITITGANLTSTSAISFDSQFTTDGHSIGSITFNSPTEIVVPITTGASSGSYTMTITNTDGLSTSVTDIYQVSTHQLYALDSIGKFTSIDDMTYGADSYGETLGQESTARQQLAGMPAAAQ